MLQDKGGKKPVVCLAISVFSVALAMIVVCSPFFVSQVSAQSTQVIVWDATSESGCTVSEETDGVPQGEVACPPGSIIASSTDPEVIARGNGTVIELTGDQEVDAQLVEEAVSAYAPIAKSSMASCTAVSRSINGRYNIGGGVQAYYTLNYKLRSDCLVYDVQDRGRADVGTFGFWKNSCSNGTSGCYARNMYLPVAFTPYYAVPDGFYGTQYRHTTAAGSTNYYGFWWYD